MLTLRESLAIKPGSLNLCASMIDVAHTAAAAGAACCRLPPPDVLYAFSMLSAAAFAMMAVTAALLLPLLLLLLPLPVSLLLLSSKVGSERSLTANGALVMLGQVDVGGLWGCGACRAAAWTQEWIWSGVGLHATLLLSSCSDSMSHRVLSPAVPSLEAAGFGGAEQLPQEELEQTFACSTPGSWTHL